MRHLHCRPGASLSPRLVCRRKGCRYRHRSSSCNTIHFVLNTTASATRVPPPQCSSGSAMQLFLYSSFPGPSLSRPSASQPRRRRPRSRPLCPREGLPARSIDPPSPQPRPSLILDGALAAACIQMSSRCLRQGKHAARSAGFGLDESEWSERVTGRNGVLRENEMSDNSTATEIIF